MDNVSVVGGENGEKNDWLSYLMIGSLIPIFGYLIYKRRNKYIENENNNNANSNIIIEKEYTKGEIIEIKPPKKYIIKEKEMSIFTAGSIDMGKAEDWQKIFIKRFQTLHTENNLKNNIYIFNPRREGWDSSWNSTPNHPLLMEQIEWELNALEKATVIALYFHPDSLAPISLLELGLHARSNKIIVCCPSGYHRRENVLKVCEKYNVPLADDLQSLIDQSFAKLLSSSSSSSSV